MSYISRDLAVTPVEYLKIIFPDVSFPYIKVHKMMTQEDVRSILKENGKEGLWDLPLTMIDKLYGSNKTGILVRFDDGHKESYRWFEVDKESCLKNFDFEAEV